MNISYHFTDTGKLHVTSELSGYKGRMKEQLNLQTRLED